MTVDVLLPTHLSCMCALYVRYEQHQLYSLLYRLANRISPGKISQKQIDGAKMTFKQMELIGKFVEVCKTLGVPDHECFATVDLYEQQNMNQVIICIAALMRKVSDEPSFDGAS